MSFELDILKQILVEQKRTNELLEKLVPKEQPKEVQKPQQRRPNNK